MPDKSPDKSGIYVIPTSIKVKKNSRCLELGYSDGTFELAFEFLRVWSPSAEVRGHGIGNGVLQTGKKDVTLLRIEPAGNYALKLVFDDGHDSGLYDWAYLRHLCLNQNDLWQDYLDRLAAAGKSRESSHINFKAL
ncbi:gamma-butyrobetaine hydroxylase-like domain-containing protein [Thalassolituus sp. LLYu03]|uniref:gamma-butyrobetaine hydroxylase-like domain-containing protein n=1 Tax=Thalassolituus sp. LLYu03 TaxID=3421656 RepID=UPI003D281656